MFWVYTHVLRKWVLRRIASCNARVRWKVWTSRRKQADRSRFIVMRSEVPELNVFVLQGEDIYFLNTTYSIRTSVWRRKRGRGGADHFHCPLHRPSVPLTVFMLSYGVNSTFSISPRKRRPHYFPDCREGCSDLWRLFNQSGVNFLHI